MEEEKDSKREKKIKNFLNKSTVLQNILDKRHKMTLMTPVKCPESS